MDVDAVEIRVLGCLIEKQRTTPDAYPLSLNALRLACNQATNRDPVVAYEEREIKAALDRMSNRGWTRFASGVSSRALKYRQLLNEALGLSEPEISLLGVLMLRGPQTVGELKQRSERLHRFGSIAEVGDVLEGLTQRELVARLERRQGQKEERWQQLLGGDAEATAEPVAPVVTPEADEGADRIGAIEERLERLEGAFDELIARLDKVPDRE
ncbi:MAG TPA: YceH family protein [Gaiellaceae bacterium]|nr:YceH family protein [Gaiellaceae bacterium]